MGLRMTYTVIGWWVYELTQNPLALGMVGLSEVVAALSFALYAGHYIDRNENKSLLLKCVILYFCAVLLFFFISDNGTTKNLSPWTVTTIILAVIFLTGVIRAFSGPTFSALISKIVPKPMLTSAASISSATWMTGSIFGHAAGGFCIAIFGIHYTFLVVLTFVCCGYIFLNRLSAKPVYFNVSQNTWQSVKEGINYVFKTKEILGALSLDLFAVLFGGAAAMRAAPLSRRPRASPKTAMTAWASRPSLARTKSRT
jgi:MFS family permease